MRMRDTTIDGRAAWAFSICTRDLPLVARGESDTG